MSRRRKVPSYCHHKASGQAVVRIDGRDHYLGPYGSPQSHKLYQRLIAEYVTNGSVESPAVAEDSPALCEIIEAYWTHYQEYYGPEERKKSTTYNLRPGSRILNDLYGDLPVSQFGPRKLAAVREQFIERGNSRGYVNEQVDRLKRMFRWAASEELFGLEVYQRVATLRGLHRGRCDVREGRKVLPVPLSVVEATLPELPSPVDDMVRFELHTGCRPVEVCILRPCDLDRSDDVWVYQPSTHKTEHFGKQRFVAVGPKAQDVLQPYLLRAETAFCFEPKTGGIGTRPTRIGRPSRGPVSGWSSIAGDRTNCAMRGGPPSANSSAWSTFNAC